MPFLTDFILLKLMLASIPVIPTLVRDCIADAPAARILTLNPANLSSDKQFALAVPLHFGAGTKGPGIANPSPDTSGLLTWKSGLIPNRIYKF